MLPRVFAMLTRVEVLDDGGGKGLRLIEHKSCRYNLGVGCSFALAQRNFAQFIFYTPVRTFSVAVGPDVVPGPFSWFLDPLVMFGITANIVELPNFEGYYRYFNKLNGK
ncbi:hypothetical protein QYE76_020284 [Lolium multiflorum]|uniref:Uncharacterized protein n=1 Tax=Lolium multiflorum TaxID=4521 RepID=A0AAD8R5L2_LOLMU|nr:hypothetical protein QYE76_020284 [Lolium multiflorum]